MQSSYLKRVHDAPGYKFAACGPFTWTIPHTGEQIVIPRGFLTDGMTSSPDNSGFAFLFHDYLYATHCIGERTITRQQADQIMCDILEFERAPLKHRFVAFIFKLNPFFLVSRAWKTSGKRGPEFYTGDLTI